MQHRHFIFAMIVSGFVGGIGVGAAPLTPTGWYLALLGLALMVITLALLIRSHATALKPVYFKLSPTAGNHHKSFRA